MAFVGGGGLDVAVVARGGDEGLGVYGGSGGRRW